MSNCEIVNADCLEHMRTMPDNSVDAVITDPPYGLSFMNKEWDSFGSDTRQPGDEHYVTPDNPYGRSKARYGYGPKLQKSMQEFQIAMTPVFEEALRVAKPGAHLLCFGGTRTFHRMACAIEDAGWELRDTCCWLYAQGFPKSMDVAKAIDKHLGVKRTVTGHRETDPQKGFSKVKGMGTGAASIGNQTNSTSYDLTAATSEQAKEWDGWGTCLKPAWEPIIIARKPLDGTVAHNVLTWGVGALNIDACRVPIEGGDEVFAKNPHTRSKGKDSGIYGKYNAAKSNWSGDKGRFPANLVHDGSQEVLELFPETKPSRKGKPRYGKSGNGWGMTHTGAEYDDNGSSARFFYCAKASKKDRNSGCEDLLTWEHDQELTRLLEQSSQLLKDISECTTLSQGAERCSTSLFGSSTMGLSQTECRFITSTVIKLTTESKTCDSSQRSSINESTLDAIRTSEESGISLARLADKLRSLRLDSTKEETDSAINAVSALFDALSEIRNCARKGNLHPTVKPTALMEWLVKLVTREGGVVLDPFMGSGSTLVACKRLDRDCVGIERESEYCDIAQRRLGDA